MAASALTDCFADLPNPRVERTCLHTLIAILVIAICAVLGGAEGWNDVAEFSYAKQQWLQERLPLENGLPCADTYRRVSARLVPMPSGSGSCANPTSVHVCVTSVTNIRFEFRVTDSISA